jgi:predicted permease
VTLDWRVCAFALAATLLTGVLFASAPAVVSSRVDLQSALRDGVTSSRGGRRLLRGMLVTVQITVSVVLLVAAGLFIRTLQNIRGLDLGVDAENLVSATVSPSRFGADAERSAAYVRELLEGVRSAPGITSAAFSWTTSFSQNRANAVYTRPEEPTTAYHAATTGVSPGLFATMGIPIVAGRDFTDAEARDPNAAVVIISQALAKAAFPNGSAIGSRLTLRFPKGKTVEVVGVIGDVRGKSITSEPEPWSYTPAVNPTWGTIQVRSSMPSAQVAATIRDVARRIDPVISPSEIEGFGASVDRAISEQRLFARTSGMFALVAAVLAGIGIYGMMAGAVAERRKEFGIRLALGARAGSVLGLVLRSAATVSAIGLLFGLACSVVLRRLLESRLFGVNGLDPTTMAATAVAIAALTLIASLVPALRAARVDPVRSLRVDA